MRKVLYIMGQLNDHDVEWMSRTGRRIVLMPGDVIINQGVQVADLFIVLSGVVEVSVTGAGVVAHLSSGEIIGEMSFVDKALPSATVRASEPVILLALNKQQMDARLASDSGFAARFYKALSIYLADRLRSMTGKSDELEEDELDETVLDQVGMAGVRFQHMLKTLLSANAL
jgi:CRP-like cAMP-binding protein